MRQVDVRSIMITERATKSIGIYLRELGKIPVLTIEEENELCSLVRQGDKKAEGKLIVSNLRFVVSVAKRYYSVLATERTFDLSDLISFGNIGLINAVRKHDPTKGFRLISYAVWHIRQQIFDFLSSHKHNISIPARMNYSISLLNKDIEKRMQENCYHVDPIEVIFNAKLTYRSIENILRAHAVLKVPFVRIDHPLPDIESFFDNAYCISDDEILTDPAIERIASSDITFSPDYKLQVESYQVNLERLLNTLTNREAEVLISYFGLFGEDQLTIEEIGEKYDLTGSRVQQIKDRALRRIRHSSRLPVLILGGNSPLNKLGTFYDRCETFRKGTRKLYGQDILPILFFQYYAGYPQNEKGEKIKSIKQYFCMSCGREFVLSVDATRKKHYCPHCYSSEIEIID